MSFVHLHVHSEYSLLDGHSRIPALVARARDLGMPALALTDHGVMFGAVEFYITATKAGIKPILGCEMYVAPRSRFDKEVERDRGTHHITVLAQNLDGYRNLCKLASIAQLEGFYYKPRIDREVLQQHANGLIVLSGCPSGPVIRPLRDDQPARARENLAWFRDVFPGRFFLELQDHEGFPELKQYNRELIALGREFGVPLAATNDVHYVHKSDAPAQDLLVTIGTSTILSDPKRMRMTDDSYYLKTAEEMAALFGEVPEALASTLAIAEMVDFKMELGKYHLPMFAVPEGHTADTYLRQLCTEGLQERYPVGHPRRERALTQLDYELSVIHQMGFDAYFLIVWDLIRFAREQTIWWNVRGSAAGSIVSYCLGLTQLDPLAHGLIFERFLNPARVSMPDIDLDFPDDRRQEMIEYCVHKYGADRVAQIITFGTLGARAALRDVGRALDLPLPEVDRLARLVPAIPGKPVTLANVLDPEHEFHSAELLQAYTGEDYVRDLIDRAKSLEGIARHASTHAAGVVISDRPITDYAPLHRPTKGSSEGGLGAVVQYDMGNAEAIGMLKVDFLGLSTLTLLRRTCDWVKQRHGIDIQLKDIPLDDPKIYELLSSGQVLGCFQVEGSGMRQILTQMRPTQFDHIVAVVSLYRPGPMEYIPTFIRRMHGLEPVEYRHPKLEPILGETYGICIYQEQIIRLASELAGYSPGEADTIRKAVGKKIKEKLLEHREKFIKGARECSDIDAATAAAIFDDIEKFARYGFNRAHGADYAVITCQTAYLKAHYPVEYMTALMSIERGNTEKLGAIVAEARRLGIQVLPPSVNDSDADFCIDDLPAGPAIRFGLTAVKNVGEGPVHTILSERAQNGRFRDLEDFARRVDLRQVNRRALESLIKVGALSDFGTRAQLLAALERVMGFSAAEHRAADIGQLTLFGDVAGGETLGKLPNVPDVTRKEQVEWEKDLVGTYLGEHPLQAMHDKLGAVVTAHAYELDETMKNRQVTLAGMVTSIRRLITKKGDPMAFVMLEDLTGVVEVTVFPRLWASAQDLVMVDKLLIITGKVDAQGKEPKIIADRITDKFTQMRSADRPDELPSPRARTAAARPVAGTRPQANGNRPPVTGRPPAAPARGGQPAKPGSRPVPPPLDINEPPWEPDASWDAGDLLAPPEEPPDWWDDRETAGQGAAAGSPPPRIVRPEAETGSAQPAGHGLNSSTHAPNEPAQIPDTARPAQANGANAVPVPPAQDTIPPVAGVRPSGVGSPPPASVAGFRPADSTANTTADLPRLIEVRIKRSGNLEYDKARVRTVHELLLRYPGTDRFRLVLAGARSVQLDFPNDTTGYCAALQQQITEMLGVDSLVLLEP